MPTSNLSTPTTTCEPSTGYCKATFPEVGKYLAMEDIILDSKRTQLVVKVVVDRISTKLFPMNVIVGSFQATVNLTLNASSNALDQRRRQALEDEVLDTTHCEMEATNFAMFDGVMYFAYSPCLTPVVYGMVPSTAARLDTVFIAWGTGFGATPEGNEVSLGEYSCEVLNSSSTRIYFTFGSGAAGEDPPRAFFHLSLSLRVLEGNKGHALILEEGHAGGAGVVGVKLLPVVHALSPSSGSVCGGTDVIITGETLCFPYHQTRVRLGEFPCVITEQNCTAIRCRTLESEPGRAFNVSFHLDNEPLEMVCKDAATRCVFTFSRDITLTSVSPTVLPGPDPNTLVLMGMGFSNNPQENLVRVGNFTCVVLQASRDVITCSVEALPAASPGYMLSIEVLDLASGEGRSRGYAEIPDTYATLVSEGGVVGVSPSVGSVEGGTLLNISGYGFHSDRRLTQVTLRGTPCDVRSVTLTRIECVTRPSEGGREATVRVAVTSNQLSLTSEVDFQFLPESTPTIIGITPTSGQGGQVVEITGSMFGTSPTNETVAVIIGGVPCLLDASRSSQNTLVCVLQDNFVGDYLVRVIVYLLGHAQNNGTRFHYNFLVNGIIPAQGSQAGLNDVTIYGIGFDPSYTQVEICGRPCMPTRARRTISTIQCTVPPSAGAGEEGGGEDLVCDISVTSLNRTVVLPAAYEYQSQLTPQVTGMSPEKGGTGGGTLLVFYGNSLSGSVSVFIGGSECIVQDVTGSSISCTTGPSSRTHCIPPLVHVDGMGYALSLNLPRFCYEDRWSSVFTWGGGPLPVEGDFVIVRRGQELVLDVRTPILSYLLIQGGVVRFDSEAEDNQVELHTQGVLITSGGKLVVGTEDQPFLAKTKIVIYGHTLSTEIPIYGAKTLALREGEIDMHGRPLNVTWTRLLRTAEAGDSELYLQDWVPWEAGGEIVIASTSFSQRENEQLPIASVRADVDGSVLTLGRQLSHTHIAVRQEIAGRSIETSAEVGYLTRNVVVRGNLNEEWVEEVEACPDEFRPGQFQVQTCFLGRFGNEIVNDQFGMQIMIHAPRKSEGLVMAKFSYLEVIHAGQAFRLGRYPIHFHLSGDVSGSYVKGCSIHHTFNRAVTVHGVDNLVVADNVAYNVMGHGYFLEDGNEQFNVIRGNLGVFIRASSSLLNVDITPATFWIVNANNNVTGNAAAGGTHFGFWYRLPEHPTGPSFDAGMCPRKQRVREFADNSAHSFGWYGLWMFREYHPSLSGQCGDSSHAPSHFDRFLSWRNDRGVEFAEAGALQLRDSVLLDNKLAGVEMVEVKAGWGEETGALVSNTLIVGHSEITTNEETCTEGGIITPVSYHLTVSSVTLANFDREGCHPILSCSQCKVNQGGFETRYRNITLLNAGEALTRWDWPHEHVHRDMDGTLVRLSPASGGPPFMLLPTTELLDPSQCLHHTQSSEMGGVQGSLCSGGGNGMAFGRLAIFDPAPSSLVFSDITLTNEHGTTLLRYAKKRKLVGDGYMSLVPLNTTYYLNWTQGSGLTNISYNLLLSGLGEGDYLIPCQRYPRPPDITSFEGLSVGGRNVSDLDDPSSAQTGDYVISGNTVCYIVKGDHSGRVVRFSTVRCFYENCIIPPPPTLPPPVPLGRPPENETMLWSDPATWPDDRVPGPGECAILTGPVYVIIDVSSVDVSCLNISNGATVEVLDDGDHVIYTDIIIISGGRFVAGYPDLPFTHSLRICLRGNLASPEFRLGPFSPIVGAKAIAVFGELVLNAAPPLREGPMWTLLAETASAGASSLLLVERVGWEAGQQVVLTSTSFDAYETEVFEILSVSPNGRTLRLNGTLLHTHLAVETTHYSVRAEVGLLSRKIVIENADPLSSDREAFGFRVLVSSSPFYGVLGSALLRGVEFRGFGQLGFTDELDPRFGLAFVNVGEGRLPSYVTDCSFHNGYNTALGVFRTNGLRIEGNVIHSTVGASMWLTGARHLVTHNLASLSQFLGSYRGRDEPLNSHWTPNFELAGATWFNFTHNHAAGGARAGFHMFGEDCSGQGDGSVIQDNVAHSSLHGVHMGYSDGWDSACSRFRHFTAYSCYHYGFFSYSKSAIQIQHSAFVANMVGIYVSVMGPTARSHKVGNKTVRIERVVIICTLYPSSPLRCELEEKSVPDIANHKASHSGIQTLTGGRVGLDVPNFVSSSGHFPGFAWSSVSSYPAINGVTYLVEVIFAYFEENCDHKDAAIMTNPNSEDANHPIRFQQISFLDDVGPVDERTKVFIHDPRVSRINPSDCVDMDCDGMKQVVFKDMDGSFTGTGSPHTLISRAEFGWDGEDRRRGVGYFRVPRTMLTSPADGSRIDAQGLYPAPGIVRGQSYGDEAGGECVYMEDWHMYACRDMCHDMLVLESMDVDTESRRLSPIGLGANGFINLLNGPMDNGWCGGYTCQERISNFYGIVASGYTYTVGMTSVNPQDLTIHLIDSEDCEGIILAIIYTNPQRLDVFTDQYVIPNNGMLSSDGQLLYADATLPSDQFIPTMQHAHGANFFDTDEKRLYVRVRGGGGSIKIVTQPLVMLANNLSVDLDSFFEEEDLVRNLALLLGIPANKIRTVMVVEETADQGRRKRSSDGGGVRGIYIVFEISEPPTSGGDEGEGEESSEGGSLHYEELLELAEVLATAFQTGGGAITEGMPGVSVVGVTLTEPAPPPVDPTNGVLATPETGGPQPGDNGTASLPTYYQIQVLHEEEEEANSSLGGVSLSLPAELTVIHDPPLSGAVEGVALSAHMAPVLLMTDINGDPALTLGLHKSWVVNTTLLEAPPSAFLTGGSVEFSYGVASFEGLVFSHPGNYILRFEVTYPKEAVFVATPPGGGLVTVEARELGLRVLQQPGDADTIFPLDPPPSVELVDLAEGGNARRVEDHLWRNVTWYVQAQTQAGGAVDCVELVDGVATFSNLRLPSSPGEHRLVFQAFEGVCEEGEPLYDPVTSGEFSVEELLFTRLLYTYSRLNYQNVVGSGGPEFHRVFQAEFEASHEGLEVYNVTSRPGSILVSLFVTARDGDHLIREVEDIVGGVDSGFSFSYGGTRFVASSVEQDPAYPLETPPSSEAHRVVVYVLSILMPGLFFLTGGVIFIVAAYLLYRRNCQYRVNVARIMVSHCLIYAVSCMMYCCGRLIH